MGGKPFSESEIKYIKEHIDDMNYKQIGAALDRSANSVAQFCMRQGIKRSKSRVHENPKGKHLYYSHDEIRWIRKNMTKYATREDAYNAFCAKFGNVVTFHAFCMKVSRLVGDQPKGLVYRRWSNEDIEYIRSNINSMSYRQLGDHFGITSSAIVHLCMRRGIKKRK